MVLTGRLRSPGHWSTERRAGSRRGPGLGPSVWVGSLEEGGVRTQREEFESNAVDKKGRDACEDQGKQEA